MLWLRTILTLLLIFAGFEISKAQSLTSRPAQPTAGSTSQRFSNRAEGISDSLSTRVSGIKRFPARYISKVSSKTNRLNSRITHRTAKALRRLEKQEKKIRRRLAGIDSLAANNLLTKSIDSLGQLKDIISGKVTNITERIPGSQYIPYLDTLKNSLNFLDKYKDRFNGIKAFSRMKEVSGQWKKLQSSLDNVQELEGRLGQIQNIQQYINQQQQVLSHALSGYGDIFNRYMGKFGREVYYYQDQLKTYKETWQHPDQMEAKALEILNKVPAFSGFMKEHSMLAGLFRLPETYGNPAPASLNGLQTRAMVEREIQERLQAAGAGGSQQIQQQMAQARQQLQQLKDKLPGSGSSAEMPNFKPNDLKSKTAFQRLEFGANMQFSKADNYFPTTSDIAAQVAYKFSKKGSAGVGLAFKLGWGSNIRKIRFTAQGLGIRTFIDYKIHGTLYINGGAEMNYNKTIPNIPALRELNGWTRSALLGIERKYKISDKVNGNMMLLFDFLYKQHLPSQPLVFRVGYNF